MKSMYSEAVTTNALALLTWQTALFQEQLEVPMPMVLYRFNDYVVSVYREPPQEAVAA